MSKNVLSIDWCYDDDDKEIIIPTKYVIFDYEKKRVIVKYNANIDDLRVKSDAELDMIRKELYNMGKYDLEDGELFE